MSLGKLTKKRCPKYCKGDDETESENEGPSKSRRRTPREEEVLANLERRAKKRRRYEESDNEEFPSKATPVVSKVSSLGELTAASRGLSGNDKPAELFRKDLISAMKLADSEPLLPEEYILISDPWRQEWEKGVQVPVNPDAIKHPKIITYNEKSMQTAGNFKLPRKLLHAVQDETYKQGLHELTGMPQLIEQVCRYDLDDLDVEWLSLVNEKQQEMGQPEIEEWVVEKVIEELETQCHENMQNTIKTCEGLGLEWDEDIICDVCRSPDSEDMNEMVFCDHCDICVHQACYGITKVPEGNWLCRTCVLGIKPECILCPKLGGAMKSTKSGTKWAHVSCALWIPEVSIGDAEKMEPIIKISQIPASRWALTCNLCKQKNSGACIQCSVKTCKTAFHVTCAFQNNLEMRTMWDDNSEDVQLKAFCSKHRKSSEGGGSNPASPRKELTREEQENMRKQKLSDLENEFYTCVDIKEVTEKVDFSKEIVDLIFQYWQLKRRAKFNKPLMMPKTDEADLFDRHQEDSLIARMKMFIHLRQDLERVRNLCYMVTRREKTRRSYYHCREDVFRKQSEIVAKSENTFSDREIRKLVKTGRDDRFYDTPELHLDMPSCVNVSKEDIDKEEVVLSDVEDVDTSSPSSSKENTASQSDCNSNSPRHRKHNKRNNSSLSTNTKLLDSESEISCSSISRRRNRSKKGGNLLTEASDLIDNNNLDQKSRCSDFNQDDSDNDSSCHTRRLRSYQNKSDDFLDVFNPEDVKDVTVLLHKSKFLVESTIKKKIQSHVYRSRKSRPINGVKVDIQQKTLDAFFKPIPRPPDRKFSLRDTKSRSAKINGTPFKIESINTDLLTGVPSTPQSAKKDRNNTLVNKTPRSTPSRSCGVRRRLDSGGNSPARSMRDVHTPRSRKDDSCSESVTSVSSAGVGGRRITRSTVDETSRDSVDSGSRYSMRSHHVDVGES